MKKILKNSKLITIVFLLGTIFGTTIGIYAESTLKASSEVVYDNTTSGSTYNNVQDALTDLYRISKTISTSSSGCPTGYACLPQLGSNVTDDDEDGKLSVGDRVTYTINTEYNGGATYTETFRVSTIDLQAGIIKLLPEHNLLLPTAAPYPHQDPADGVNKTAFSDSAYWSSSGIEDYSINPYVYNENSILYDYVEKYRQLLESAGVPIKLDNNTSTIENRSVRLLTYDEVVTIESLSWSHSQNYWIGAASGSSRVRVMYSSGISSDGYNNTSSNGVRPIIILDLAGFVFQGTES